MAKNSSKTKSPKKDPKELDIPINEFFQLILNEYNNERNRKQSIETRSGIILSLLATFFVFILERIKIADIISLFELPLTFSMLVTILSGLAFYVCLFLSVLFALRSIGIQKYAFYNVNRITTAVILSPRIPELGQIILDFNEAIQANRLQNDKKAKYFNFSIIFLVVCITCLCIYINLSTGGING